MIDSLRSRLGSLVPSGTLLERSIKSGIWASTIKIVNRLLQILLLILLARILVPRDFGLMGIALLTLGATQQLTKIGLDTALIHEINENIDDYLDTTWVLEVSRGILIFTLLFFTAPFISNFFNEPDATLLIQVIGLSPLFAGLCNPGVVYFRKNLDFHKEFVYQASGGVTQFVVGIGYAWYSPTVWALVFAFVATDLMKFILSYVLHGYRPWPSFDRKIAAELIDYGKWITGSSIIYYLYSQGDDAFVGWYLSATALGFYQYAYRIADIPSTEVSEVVASITFPAYAKLQDQPQQLKQALLGATRITCFLTFPMAFGIALVAPSFVPAILGSDWIPMIVVLQLLSLYGLLHSMTRNFGSYWKALGRPDLIAKLGFVRVICIGVLIWPATVLWGIEGTAAVVVGVFIFPMLPLEVYFITKLSPISSSELYREYLFPLVPAVTMFGVLWYATSLVELPNLVEFLVLIPSGAIVYLVVTYVIAVRFDWGVEEDIRTITTSLTA